MISPEIADRAVPTERPLASRARVLAGDVMVVTCDLPRAARNPPALSVIDGGSLTPSASLRLALADGGARYLWVVRRGRHDHLKISLPPEGSGQPFDVPLGLSDARDRLDPADLLRDATGASRLALVSALLNVWGPLFRLQQSSEFAQYIRIVLQSIVSSPIVARSIAAAGDHLLVMETSVAKEFGKIDAVYAIFHDGFARVRGAPFRASQQDGARDMVHFLADRRLMGSGSSYLVLLGAAGMSVRGVETPNGRLPSFSRWLSQAGEAAPLVRQHLILALADSSEAGRSLALEAQLRAPLQPRRVMGQRSTPGAQIVDALTTSYGTLVTGWYSDPSGLVAGLDVLGDEACDLIGSLHRFPVTVSDPKDGGRISATGFATLAPTGSGTVPLLQPRFRLRLKSGSRHVLVPPVQPSVASVSRAAALRAVPPEHVCDELLDQVLAPAIADLHATVQASVGESTSQTLGTPLSRPKVSLVIPLYKVLDFLRFQIAAFAADAWLRRNAELIFVLDSPEQANEALHLLGGLHLIHGMTAMLVVMERNAGYARACNTGAAIARGEILAMVNSDVIPTASGWLEGLVSRLSRQRRIGAVGPKLLFEDGSIQHAGMYFAKDHRGRWLNQHFHKGMPRFYRPALEERIVPAVTGACLVLRRALFEQVGGFSEDYVIGDYEDSDLCLKITQAGNRISYVPDVELYHLERKSMSVNADYTRGIAWQYNCLLHTKRWSDLLAFSSAAELRKKRGASL